MLQTYGLSHLQICVVDLERSVRFYKGLFGMNEVRRFDNCVMLQTPGTKEIFTINSWPEDAKNAGKMGGFAHFGFRLKEPMEMTKVFEEITELGGRPIEKGGSLEKGRLFAMANDPDGYEVEVFWES